MINFLTRSSAAQLFSFAVLVAIAIIFPDIALAQAPEDNLASGIVNNFRTTMAGIGGNLITLATNTFYLLATIEVVYFVSMKAMSGGEPGDVIRGFIKRMINIGFWGFMMANAVTHVDLLLSTMYYLAQSASSVGLPGQGNIFNPDDFLDVGIDVVAAAVDRAPGSPTQIGTAIGMVMVGGLIFLTLLVIACNMVLALLEIYILGYGGVFLLAFGASSLTNSYAQAYLRYLLSVGIKIFCLALIATLALQTLNAQMATMEYNITQLFSTLGMTAILAYMAHKAPAAIQGVISGVSSGSSGVSGGAALRGASAAVSGGAGAGAAVLAAGGAAAGGAAAAKAGGAGISGAAAAGLGKAASAVVGAAADSAKEAVMGKSSGSPFPASGTAGGRLAAKITARANK